mmetsp:Transcript_9796/g.16835  ORF Transcript_9796/g.16835 Transcript_9796/m.16835 type:complete len:196 (+) Transcript_9796:242-829(+)|eukprot:CAMPEP_0198205104 /NCGR_PEP_ID=MMETSP1445-20131203/8574_1 /TAXON_ID=36898 /ORGANISM="Pyramimonas sp., Strain CCMP2087" /LENGTH=195 /DNA_ID=CAMNT_0043877255 /DNA_START=199 /DNA_END=786 /DNA_ORIENTATION=-
MDMANFASEFELLSKLVSEDVEDEHAAKNSQRITPASFGGPAPTQAQIDRLAKPKVYKNPKDIWDVEELEEHIDDEVEDGRERPRFEFLYRQAVGTEDAYLGLSDKDPSSTCCEDLIIRIELPGTNSMAELDLDVQKTYIRLESPLYKLAVYLPHEVDEERGNAKWDKTKEALSISLPIIRQHIVDAIAEACSKY